MALPQYKYWNRNWTNFKLTPHKQQIWKNCDDSVIIYIYFLLSIWPKIANCKIAKRTKAESPVSWNFYWPGVGEWIFGVASCMSGADRTAIVVSVSCSCSQPHIVLTFGRTAGCLCKSQMPRKSKWTDNEKPTTHNNLKKVLKYCIENKMAAWGLDDGNYQFSLKIPNNNKVYSLHSTPLRSKLTPVRRVQSN